MMSRRSGWLSLSVLAVAVVAPLASVLFGWHGRQIWFVTDVQLALLMVLPIGYLLLLVCAIASITRDIMRNKAGADLAAECCVCGGELQDAAEACRGCGLDWHREAFLDAEPTPFAGWPPRCRECGYDLSGLEEALPCPECGTVDESPPSAERQRVDDWVLIHRGARWLAMGSAVTLILGSIMVSLSPYIAVPVFSVLHGVCVLIGCWWLYSVEDGRQLREEHRDLAPWFVIDGLVLGWVVWLWIVVAWLKMMTALV